MLLITHDMGVVADMSVLLAEVEVSEVDVVNVALGQEAEVKVDALGTEPQKGHVVEIATSGRRDPTQGTIRFRVKVALDDPEGAERTVRHLDIAKARTAFAWDSTGSATRKASRS